MTWKPGGGGSSVIPFVTNVGTGAAGPYSITHNLGTKNFIPIVRRNPGHVDNAGLANPGEMIQVQVVPNGNNGAFVKPDETWTTNQYQVALWPVGGDDVTAPAAPTLTLSTKDTTTATFTATATDNVGVVFYDWLKDGAYVATTFTNSYTFTGLTAATAYNFTVQAGDLQVNKSAVSNTVAVTTDTTPSVAYAGQGAGLRTTASSVGNWTHTVGAGSNRWLIVAIATTHIGGAWGNDNVTGSYSTYTVQSDKGTDGVTPVNLTYLGGVANGVSGQTQGQLMYYGLQNPFVGTHTFTPNFVFGGVTTSLALMANSFVYTGVGSLGAVITQAPYASGALALNVTGITAGDMAFGGGIFDAAATPVALGKTARFSNGAAIGGQGDYVAIADSATTGTQSFTTSSTAHYRAGAGFRLIHA